MLRHWTNRKRIRALRTRGVHLPVLADEVGQVESVARVAKVLQSRESLRIELHTHAMCVEQSSDGELVRSESTDDAHHQLTHVQHEQTNVRRRRTFHRLPYRRPFIMMHHTSRTITRQRRYRE